jgi:hypothetical protein
LGGKIVPRFGPLSLLAPLGDGIFWDWLGRNIQGNDRPSILLAHVGEGPLAGRKCLPLPAPINQDLVRRATRDAPMALEKLRVILGLTALEGARQLSLRALRAIVEEHNLTWDMLLIHTSYFSTGPDDGGAGASPELGEAAPAIPELLALHIEQSMVEAPWDEIGPREEEPLRAWLRLSKGHAIASRPPESQDTSPPRAGRFVAVPSMSTTEGATELDRSGLARWYRREIVRADSAAMTLVILGVMAISSLSAGVLIEQVRVYTPRYQIDRAVTDAPVLDVADRAEDLPQGEDKKYFESPAFHRLQHTTTIRTKTCVHRFAVVGCG